MQIDMNSSASQNSLQQIMKFCKKALMAAYLFGHLDDFSKPLCRHLAAHLHWPAQISPKDCSHPSAPITQNTNINNKIIKITI